MATEVFTQDTVLPFGTVETALYLDEDDVLTASVGTKSDESLAVNGIPVGFTATFKSGQRLKSDGEGDRWYLVGLRVTRADKCSFDDGTPLQRAAISIDAAEALAPILDDPKLIARIKINSYRRRREQLGKHMLQTQRDLKDEEKKYSRLGAQIEEAQVALAEEDLGSERH